VPYDQARDTLTRLIVAHLLTEHTPGRYTCHDLLRAYAVEQAHTHDTDAQRHDALHRVLDHYAHTCYAARRVLHPDWPSFELVPYRSGVTPEHLADEDQAVAWCGAEQIVLLAATVRADEAGFVGHAWQIPEALAHFFRQGAYRHEWADTQRRVLATAERTGDLAGQAHSHRYLSDTLVGAGAYAEARAHMLRAVTLFERLGDHVWQGVIHQDLGWAFNRQGRYAEALAHNQRALAMFQTADDRGGQAAAMNSVGWSHAQLGNHQEALVHCLRALDLLRELKDLDGEAATLDSVGYAYHQLGQYGEALTYYQRALALFRRVGGRYGQADTLTHLGDTHHATGDLDAARDAWQQALVILDDLDHPDASAVRAKLRSASRGE
jgi:tetratricopeptide (TPR) repeat protein